MKKFFSRPETSAVKNTVRNALFWIFVLLYLELTLHVRFYEACSVSCLYILGFTAMIGLLISCLLGFLPCKANKIVSMVLVCVLAVVYCTQIVYEAVFGTMYSMSQIGLGGDALTSFWRETLLAMLESLPVLLLMLLPIPATAVLLKKDPLFSLSRDWLRLAVLVLAVIFHFATVGCLQIGGTGDYTDYYFYYNDKATTDQSAERFGLLTTMRLELFSGKTPAEDLEAEDPVLELPEVQETEPPATEITDPTEPTEIEYGYNTLEIDFDYLNTQTKDEQVLALNQYIASLTGTKQNKYTGMLADYNLITLCAESFAPGAIDKELTPTLYKMVNEGFVFNNYYNSYPNNTTDGEYSFCLGLWPDTGRNKEASSFYATRNSYLPFALGNVFQEQLGIQSYGYHNYSGSYYGRYETHPNMGYKCKFAWDGMRFSSDWPSSDLEMMEQSIGDYINSGEQFHAYYMTFSGHVRYDTSVNSIAARNYDKVKDLPYSEAAKCYLACNIELDKALAYLLNALEEAGIADKTAIVLAGDHYPYGLRDKHYSQLVGYEIDDSNKYKSNLIFWVGGMEETVYVDEYMCNVDILPTILNLWGFSYDSRLLAGTDIFSDSEHIAILRDQSFFTDKVWFNASTGEATWFVDESTVEPDYLDKHIKLVKNRFAFSSSILNEAYYNFLFEKGKVNINRESWKEEEKETPAPTETPEKVETTPTEAPETGEVTPTEKPETGDGTGGNTGDNSGGNPGDNSGDNSGGNAGDNAGGSAGDASNEGSNDNAAEDNNEPEYVG